MTVSLKKWGNSLAVRIPKDIAQTLGLDNDSLMELVVKDGTLVLEPKKNQHLEELLLGINSSNVHGEVEMTWGMGNEEW